jgi:hypothetical protein
VASGARRGRDIRVDLGVVRADRGRASMPPRTNLRAGQGQASGDPARPRHTEPHGGSVLRETWLRARTYTSSRSDGDGP